MRVTNTSFSRKQREKFELRLSMTLNLNIINRYEGSNLWLDKDCLTQSRKVAKVSNYFFASWRLGVRIS